MTETFQSIFGQMTEMFQRNKAGEKKEVINMASEYSYSVTMSDRHVVSQYYSFAIMLGGVGATCPTCALGKGAVLTQLCS